MIMIIKLSFLGNILFTNCLLRRLLSHFTTSASTPACEKRCRVSLVQIKPETRRRGQELNSSDLELWSSKYLLLDGVTWPKELLSSVGIRESIDMKFTCSDFHPEERHFWETCMHAIRGISVRAFYLANKAERPVLIDNEECHIPKGQIIHWSVCSFGK